MAKQTALELKRKEVREEILAMKEKIPTALVLNFLGRAFEKGSIWYWLSTIISLNIILFLVWLLTAFALGELEQKNYLWNAALFATELLIAGLMLNYALLRTLFTSFAEHVVEKINNMDDLSNLTAWIKGSWSAKKVLVFTFIFWQAWVLLGIGGISVAYQSFVGVGFSLAVIFIGFLAGINFHGIFWLNMFIVNLKNYQYETSAFSPADSEVLHDISEIFNFQLYGLAMYFALGTLLGSTNLLEDEIQAVFATPFFTISWVTIISQFILARNTLGYIVKKRKWKTLNKIQGKINSLESTGDLSDKETAERLLRLAEIHKQIMVSKTNTFDLKSLSTLFSQLMLPLLGLLLGNLDKVLALLPK